LLVAKFFFCVVFFNTEIGSSLVKNTEMGLSLVKHTEKIANFFLLVVIFMILRRLFFIFFWKTPR